MDCPRIDLGFQEVGLVSGVMDIRGGGVVVLLHILEISVDWEVFLEMEDLGVLSCCDLGGSVLVSLV